MTRPNHSNRFNEAVELLVAHGFEEMGKSLEILFNTAMLLERERYLGAAPYERTRAMPMALSLRRSEPG